MRERGEFGRNNKGPPFLLSRLTFASNEGLPAGRMALDVYIAERKTALREGAPEILSTAAERKTSLRENGPGNLSTAPVRFILLLAIGRRRKPRCDGADGKSDWSMGTRPDERTEQPSIYLNLQR